MFYQYRQTGSNILNHNLGIANIIIIEDDGTFEAYKKLRDISKGIPELNNSFPWIRCGVGTNVPMVAEITGDISGMFKFADLRDSLFGYYIYVHYLCGIVKQVFIKGQPIFKDAHYKNHSIKKIKP